MDPLGGHPPRSQEPPLKAGRKRQREREGGMRIGEGRGQRRGRSKKEEERRGEGVVKWRKGGR